VNIETKSDEYEDAGYKMDAGNNITDSFPIFPGEIIDIWPGRGRTGKLSSNDKEDWFSFSICNGQEIKITMTPPSDYNFDISLWDENQNERAKSTNSGNMEESISFIADKTDHWYVKIYYISGASEGKYFFDVELVGQNDADFGYDAGDSFNSATEISFGNFEGYLDMNDEEDWYKFNVNEGQNIHFILLVENYAYLSDFDIYLYSPNGSFILSENLYYDDELFYSIDQTGYWRIRIKIFPGYSDIPVSSEYDYFSYGSGAYKLLFNLVSTAPNPPDPVQQPEIIPIAQTFNIVNDPLSNKDEYGYLASIPACNYVSDGKRYVSPIIYSGDLTKTNWFGSVDDTTDYLLNDWNTYLNLQGKTATQYNVPNDPIKAAADIAKLKWNSSDLAVVSIDGSEFQDDNETVLYETKTLSRNVKTKIIPNTSRKIKKMGNSYFYPIALSSKWGAINVSMYGPNIPGEGLIHIFPSLIQLFPKFMTLTSDWWPKYDNIPRYDIYYPVTNPGIWAAGVKAPLGEWDFIITKYECNRFKIKIDDPDSVLNVKISSKEPSDLLVFLIDPEGHLRGLDIPDWNGGPINPIHVWHGFDDGDSTTSCSPWRDWNPEPHSVFSVDILHPEKGTWEAIIVPRNSEGSSSIKYTITGSIRKLNHKRVNAAVSASNAAVIASQENVPLLYVKEDSIPMETQDVFETLGIKKVIFVEKDDIGNLVKNDLPELKADLTTNQEIIDYIKNYSSSENYITITSLKTGKGFFAPSAMLAAYHGSPVLRIGEIVEKTFSTSKKKSVNNNFFKNKIINLFQHIFPIRSSTSSPNSAGWANRIDTWRLWNGDYYHGNRAPGHLPTYEEPISEVNNFKLFIEIFKYLFSGGKRGNLPPLGLDANRYWNEEMYSGIYNWINSYGLDLNGPEAYVFVSPRKDISLELHSAMMGNNSYSGHIPGKTPAYSSDIIIRNILYPALIFANPNRDIASSQLINYPDGETWITNDGAHHRVESSRVIKDIFMSHKREYEGHSLWDAHINCLNNGASIMYYSGHGTAGSGISSQYKQTENCNFPDQIWPDSWRGYMYDDWKTARDDGLKWYNPKSPNLYDFIHFKWIDNELDNLRSNAIFYSSCSTGQQFGPLVYLDHGAVIWYGNAGSGSCPQGDLMNDWFFENALINGEPIGLAYSKNVWLMYRDFTTGDTTSMYGRSSLGEITTVHCIYGDPNLILYSPDWTIPEPIDAIISS